METLTLGQDLELKRPWRSFFAWEFVQEELAYLTRCFEGGWGMDFGVLCLPGTQKLLIGIII